MEKKYIILIKFNSKEEGLIYLSNSDVKFNFTDGNNVYDINGNVIIIDGDYEIYLSNEIYIKNIKTNNVGAVLPGELYLEDNLIKYIK
tara:strand:- start:27 stop:290 length:264 start_codon:yes stop_codon:yes gene_type:complete